MKIVNIAIIMAVVLIASPPSFADQGNVDINCAAQEIPALAEKLQHLDESEAKEWIGYCRGQADVYSSLADSHPDHMRKIELHNMSSRCRLTAIAIRNILNDRALSRTWW